MQFRIFRDKANPRKWRWHLWFNKNIIATSHQGHDSPQVCFDEIQNVQNSANAPIRTEKDEHKTDQSKTLHKLNMTGDG